MLLWHTLQFVYLREAFCPSLDDELGVLTQVGHWQARLLIPNDTHGSKTGSLLPITEILPVLQVDCCSSYMIASLLYASKQPKQPST